MLVRKKWLVLATAFLMGLGVSCLVAQELDVEAPANEALELLDQATEKKLFAERMSDLDGVVELCEQAIEKGLPDDGKNVATELMSATLFEKASRVLAPVLEGQIDASWRQRRRMALESLTKAMEISPDNGEVHMLFAQLADLPGGDRDAGMEAANKAVKLLWKNPARRSEALLTRATFQEDDEERFKDVTQAVEADANNAEALSERAQLHLFADRNDEAIADLTRVLELEDDDGETQETIVRILTDNEEFDKAIRMLTKMIEDDPTSSRPFVLRAGIYSVQEKTEDAMADLNMAADLDPSDVTAFLTRAQLNAEQEKYEEALADVERSLELSPGLPIALQIRSMVWQLTKKYDKAIRDLRRILRRDPDNVALRLQIASIYVIDKRSQKAITMYTRIIEEDEHEWEALRGRADAYLGLGDHKKAIADYETALEQADDDSGILNNLAWVMATSPVDDVRNAARAIELAEKACELTDYQAAHILSTLAASHAEAGDFDEAIKWSKKAVDLGGGQEGLDEQLTKELETYQRKEPWREKQTQEGQAEEEQPSLSDLDLGLDDAKIPSDP